MNKLEYKSKTGILLFTVYIILFGLFYLVSVISRVINWGMINGITGIIKFLVFILIIYTIYLICNPKKNALFCIKTSLIVISLEWLLYTLFVCFYFSIDEDMLTALIVILISNYLWFMYFIKSKKILKKLALVNVFLFGIVVLNRLFHFFNEPLDHASLFTISIIVEIILIIYWTRKRKDYQKIAGKSKHIISKGKKK